MMTLIRDYTKDTVKRIDLENYNVNFKLNVLDNASLTENTVLKQNLI